MKTKKSEIKISEKKELFICGVTRDSSFLSQGHFSILSTNWLPWLLFRDCTKRKISNRDFEDHSSWYDGWESREVLSVWLVLPTNYDVGDFETKYNKNLIRYAPNLLHAGWTCQYFLGMRQQILARLWNKRPWQGHIKGIRKNWKQTKSKNEH